MPLTITSPTTEDTIARTTVQTQIDEVRFTSINIITRINKPLCIRLKWIVGFVEAGGKFRRVVDNMYNVTDDEVAEFETTPIGPGGTVLERMERKAFNFLIEKGEVPPGTITTLISQPFKGTFTSGTLPSLSSATQSTVTFSTRLECGPLP